jgi:hypothetical protein
VYISVAWRPPQQLQQHLQQHVRKQDAHVNIIKTIITPAGKATPIAYFIKVLVSEGEGTFGVSPLINVRGMECKSPLASNGSMGGNAGVFSITQALNGDVSVAPCTFPMFKKNKARMKTIIDPYFFCSIFNCRTIHSSKACE